MPSGVILTGEKGQGEGEGSGWIFTLTLAPLPSGGLRGERKS